MTDARIMRATLGFLFEPGDRRLAELLASHGLTDTYNLVTRGTTSFTPRAELGGLTTAQMADAADAAVTYASAGGGRIVIPDDEDWPVGLDDARDWAPVCLWVAGPGSIPQPQRSVTVVGARACTAYGEHVATDLAAGLADKGRRWCTSNGFGVDRAVLRAAAGGRRAPGRGRAVRPGPTPQRRPGPSGRQLADAGLLITGFPPGARTNRARADLNRLYLAVLTARHRRGRGAAARTRAGRGGEALRHGRAVMAVPGPVTSVMSTRLPPAAARPPARCGRSPASRTILTDLRGAFTPVWPRTRRPTMTGPA